MTDEQPQSAERAHFLGAFASILESFALLHGFIPNQLLWICPEIMVPRDKGKGKGEGGKQLGSQECLCSFAGFHDAGWRH